MKVLKLSEYARREGILYRAAYNRFKQGKIPNARLNDAGGIIIVEDDAPVSSLEVVVYARVSTGDQRSSLDGQVSRCITHANSHGLSVHRVIKEIASGLNDDRPKLSALLQDKNIGTIVVEHRDRLTRFGFRYIDILLKSQGRRVLVVNEVDSDRDDLMQDFVSVITSFCARLYSRRRSRRQVEKIIRLSAESDDNA